MSREIPDDDEWPKRIHEAVKGVVPTYFNYKKEVEATLDPVSWPFYMAMKNAFRKAGINSFSFITYSKGRDFIKQFSDLLRNSKREAGMDESIDIKQLENIANLFGELLEEFLKNYVNKDNIEFRRNDYTGFFNFFSDMTLHDFKNCEDFMKRRLEELKTKIYVPCSEKTILDEDRSVSIEFGSEVASGAMEGYHDFKFKYLLANEGRKASLPTVRYGVYDQNRKGVIYCFQNETIVGSGLNYEQIKAELAFIEAGKAKYKDLIDNGTLHKDFPDDSFYPTFGRLLRHGWYDASDFLSKWRLEDYYLDLLKKAEEERATKKDLSKRLTTKDKSIPSGVRSVQGGALVSGALAVKKLHEAGVREIRVPLNLPNRLHTKYNETDLDKKIFEGKLNICRRLAYEFEGIYMVEGNFEFDMGKLVRREPCGDDYAVLRLGEVIKPRRDAVKEFFGEAFAV